VRCVHNPMCILPFKPSSAALLLAKPNGHGPPMGTSGRPFRFAASPATIAQPRLPKACGETICGFAPWDRCATKSDSIARN